ncbi:MAG: hypothetical protein JRL30_10380 [Deltaproteobacteria bacterium]|nr:hypothetical protein [Deltaproteobacteria bacterium]
MAKVLSDAKDLCDQNNVKLMVIFQANSKIDKTKWHRFVKRAFGSNIDFKAMCKKICTKNAIPFLDLQNRSPKETYFLTGDDHYSPEGNKWAAKSIYHELG